MIASIGDTKEAKEQYNYFINVLKELCTLTEKPYHEEDYSKDVALTMEYILQTMIPEESAIILVKSIRYKMVAKDIAKEMNLTEYQVMQMYNLAFKSLLNTPRVETLLKKGIREMVDEAFHVLEVNHK